MPQKLPCILSERGAVQGNLSITSPWWRSTWTSSPVLSQLHASFDHRSTTRQNNCRTPSEIFHLPSGMAEAAEGKQCGERWALQREDRALTPRIILTHTGKSENTGMAAAAGRRGAIPPARPPAAAPPARAAPDPRGTGLGLPVLSLPASRPATAAQPQGPAVEKARSAKGSKRPALTSQRSKGHSSAAGAAI